MKTHPFTREFGQGLNCPEAAYLILYIQQGRINPVFIHLLESGSKNRVISTYIINSKTTVVPTFGSNDDISLTHVKEDVCPLKGCKRLNNLHTLAKKSSIRLCLHSLLSIRCSPKPVKKQRSITIAKADHRKTVEKLLQQVNEYFPDVGDENFHISLPSNKRFIDEVRY